MDFSKKQIFVAIKLFLKLMLKCTVISLNKDSIVFEKVIMCMFLFINPGIF